jgi:hypothetical protein
MFEFSAFDGRSKAPSAEEDGMAEDQGGPVGPDLDAPRACAGILPGG